MLPFENESESTQVGDLTIENRVDHVSIYGSLSITFDLTGLAQAIELQEIINAVVARLQSEELPITATTTEAPLESVTNPFAAT